MTARGERQGAGVEVAGQTVVGSASCSAGTKN